MSEYFNDRWILIRNDFNEIRIAEIDIDDLTMSGIGKISEKKPITKSQHLTNVQKADMLEFIKSLFKAIKNGNI